MKMPTKHKFFSVMAVILITVLLVAACTAKPAPASPSKPEAAAGPKPKGELQKTLVMPASATGGSYIYTAALATILNKYLPVEASQTIFTGSAGKFQAMTKGEADITPISAVNPVAFMVGDEGPEMKKIRVRTLCAGGGESSTYMAILTLPNKGIKSVKDLKGKKWINAQSPSPITWVVSEAVMKVNGMTKDDVKGIEIASPPDAFRELKEGRVDAYTATLGEGSQEMGVTTGLFIVPFTPEEQQACYKANSALSPGIVPKGLKGANADTQVTTSPTVWWVSQQMSELTAYTILKTMYERGKEFGAIHPSCTGFTLENALNVWAIPYHAGAIFYFKEQGIWGAQEDKKQQDLIKLEKELTGW